MYSVLRGVTASYVYVHLDCRVKLLYYFIELHIWAGFCRVWNTAPSPWIVLRNFNHSFMTAVAGQWSQDRWRGAWFPRAICYMFRGQGFGSNFHEDCEFMDDCIQGLNPVRANIVATNRSSLYKSRYRTYTQAFNTLAWTHVQSVRCTLVGYDVLIRQKVFIFTLFFFPLVLIIGKVQRFVRNCRKKA
jgi:hypothetical protein